MNKSEEIETIDAYTSDKQNTLNDLDAVFVTPFIRYFYDFTPPNVN